MKTNAIVSMAAVLLTGSAMVLAADGRDVSAASDASNAAGDASQAAAEAGKAAGDAAKASGDAANADLEARLEAARARLEEAAHEVAELSAETGRTMMQHMRTLDAEIPPRAVIGVQLDPSSGKDGARIQDVSPGGPAAEAGLRAGDVIVAINGTEVKGDAPARQVVHLMRNVAPDGKVKVRALRDGKPREFTVTARPGAAYLTIHEGVPRYLPMPPEPPDMPDANYLYSLPLMIHGPLANMELVTLTPQLGRYFGVDKGVLVVRGPSEGDFKLEDGDVILSIDGREPTSGSHATRILGSYQPGEKITIKIMRDHKAMSVETTLPDRGIRRSRRIQLMGGGGDDART